MARRRHIPWAQYGYRFKRKRHFSSFRVQKWGNLASVRKGAGGGYDENAQSGSIYWGTSMLAPTLAEIEYRGGYLRFPVRRGEA